MRVLYSSLNINLHSIHTYIYIIYIEVYILYIYIYINVNVICTEDSSYDDQTKTNQTLININVILVISI